MTDHRSNIGVMVAVVLAATFCFWSLPVDAPFGLSQAHGAAPPPHCPLALVVNSTVRVASGGQVLVGGTPSPQGTLIVALQARAL